MGLKDEAIRKNIEEILEIEENSRIATNVYKMVLKGNTDTLTNPGQFINIKIPGFYLRRPISVCDYEPGRLTIIYKVVGNGTDAMTAMKPGDRLNALMGLGNGFDVSMAGDSPLLVGGGVGTPPMYGLAKKLAEMGKKVNVIIGFNTADEVFYKDEFEAITDKNGNKCVNLYVATVDGSVGTKGFVTNCVDLVGDISHYYACGAIPMLKALNKKLTEASKEGKYKVSNVGQLSYEERMGCGFGACVGCSIKTKSGNKRVCKDGPIFLSTDVEVE